MYNNYRNSGYDIIWEAHQQDLSHEKQNEITAKIWGYTKNKTSSIMFYILSLVLLGIPNIILHWYPRYKMIKYKTCSLKFADFILLKDNHNNYQLLKVESTFLTLRYFGKIYARYFYYQHTKYIYNNEEGLFVHFEKFMPLSTLDDIIQYSNGITESEQENLLMLYGPNKIQVEVKSYWALFCEEIFNPFYVFQLFSMILWCFDDYMIYAGCVLFLTLVSAITALIQTRKQSIALHDLVESSNIEAVEILRPNVLYGHTKLTVESIYLVPGDLIIIPRTGCVMACDAVLLKGTCIVNESMLTGESIPITKTPPHASAEIYDPLIHKRHTLYSGTHVLQTRYYESKLVLARVVRTGFETTKGSLVKSILFPSPIGLRFYSDSVKFICVLFIIALSGMFYSSYLYIQRNADLKDIIIRAIDIITIVVPPALPAAMTVGIVYSLNRLKKLGIFCISPPRINICGKLKLACFDKTGTLTHEGLDMYSVIPSINSEFIEPVTDLTTLYPNCPLLQALACCHSLTRINDELNGDPLDLSMFKSTNWVLEEPEVEESSRYDLLAPTVVKPRTPTTSYDLNEEIPYAIGILRQFPFSSSQQCMTVICRVLGEPNMLVFTKGAPEKVAAFCKPDTLPKDFNRCLTKFTAQGFRVIALAYKSLPTKFKWIEAQKIRREIIEDNLDFLGFMIMQNTLKSETTPVISALHTANIRTVMITGDNIRTAVSVARNCGMIGLSHEVIFIGTYYENGNGIPRLTFEKLGEGSAVDIMVTLNCNIHLAIDGETWSAIKTYYSDVVEQFLVRTTVFARFQPDQKTQLVTDFQKLDYIVSMVGDGANDCGALKAAHVGISISQAEASVAAPFTSRIENISCLLYLILEGRCALVTSFAVFKYMALYSLIQFFSVIILYWNYSRMGDMQFLFIDLIITTTLAITIGKQGPCEKLAAKRPMGSLVAIRNLIPLILQILTCGTIQILALCYLIRQPWFEPLPPSKQEVVVSWENTVIFCVSSFQYLILALVYSKGKPYRESVIHNFWLLFTILILICFLIMIVIYPNKVVTDFFDVIYLGHITEEQKLFRYTLLAFPLMHFVIAILIEQCLADRVWFQKLIHFMICKTTPRNKYKALLRTNDYYDILLYR